MLNTLEAEGLRMQAFSLESMTLVQDRAYRLLGLLLAGGGGLGAFALSDAVNAGPLAGALLSGALWWFCLAAWVAWRCLLSREIPNVAGDPVAWLDYLDELNIYRQDLLKEQQPVPSAAELMQRERLKAISERSNTYRQSAGGRWIALDQAYRMAALSPLVCLIGVAIGFRLA